MNGAEHRFLDAAVDVGARIRYWRSQDKTGLRADASLYGGSGGLALFFLELFRATGDAAVEEMARDELKRIQRPDDSTRAFASFMRGQMGVAYVLHRASVALSDERLAERARALACETPEARPPTEDVYGGASGAITVLSALFEETGAEEYRSAALVTGYRLFRSHVAIRPSGLSLKSDVPTLIPPLGMAHGAAGLAVAAAELYRLTGLQDYAYFARSAIEYEDVFFDSDEGTWVEYRIQRSPLLSDPEAVRQLYVRTGFREFEELSPAHAWAWCNGRSGFLAARLRMLEVLTWCGRWRPAERWSDPFWSAKSSPPGDYTYCCGFAGVAETFLYAARLFEDFRHLEAARQLGLAALAQREETGCWLAPWQREPGRSYLSLMKGMAGVGYLCLRLYDPHRFQSFLLPTVGTAAARWSGGDTNQHVQPGASLRAGLLKKYWGQTVACCHDPDETGDRVVPLLEEDLGDADSTSVRADLRTLPGILQVRVDALPQERRQLAQAVLDIEMERFRFDEYNPVLVARDLASRFFNRTAFLSRDELRLMLSPDTRLWPVPGSARRYLMYVRRGASRLHPVEGAVVSILDRLACGPASVGSLVRSSALPEGETMDILHGLLDRNIMMPVPDSLRFTGSAPEGP